MRKRGKVTARVPGFNLCPPGMNSEKMAIPDFNMLSTGLLKIRLPHGMFPLSTRVQLLFKKSKSLLSNYIELHLHIQPAFNF